MAYFSMSLRDSKIRTTVAAEALRYDWQMSKVLKEAAQNGLSELVVKTEEVEDEEEDELDEDGDEEDQDPNGQEDRPAQEGGQWSVVCQAELYESQTSTKSTDPQMLPLPPGYGNKPQQLIRSNMYSIVVLCEVILAISLLLNCYLDQTRRLRPVKGMVHEIEWEQVLADVSIRRSLSCNTEHTRSDCQCQPVLIPC
jgi:hypothetical protein